MSIAAAWPNTPNFRGAMLREKSPAAGTRERD